jgi:hypothetical protein
MGMTLIFGTLIYRLYTWAHGIPVAVTIMHGKKDTTTVAVEMPTQLGGDAANFVQICKANHLQ